MDEPHIRQRILDAALQLFANQGYGSTSVRQVVELAGVTKPTLYYYFNGKEALFREVVVDQVARTRNVRGYRCWSSRYRLADTEYAVLDKVLGNRSKG